MGPDADRWELYDLTTDFSQAHDLAGERPALLAELKELFWQEAARNSVLPLLGSYAAAFGDLPPLPTVTRLSFAGDVQNVLPGMVPRIIGRSYAIEAEPYAFTGTVRRVVFDLKPAHHEAEQDLHRHHAHQAIAQGIAG